MKKDINFRTHLALFWDLLKMPSIIENISRVKAACQQDDRVLHS